MPQGVAWQLCQLGLALTDPETPDSRVRAGPKCPDSEARLGLAGWVRNWALSGGSGQTMYWGLGWGAVWSLWLLLGEGE